MSGLFYADYPSVRPVSQIARMGARGGKDHGDQSHFIRMADDEVFNISSVEYEELLRRPMQLIPAEPGSRVIRFGRDADGEIWSLRDPVIAWALCLDGTVRPVSAGGVPSDSQDAIYVEMADGQVLGVGEYADPCSFESAADFQEHCVAVWSARDKLAAEADSCA